MTRLDDGDTIVAGPFVLAQRDRVNAALDAHRAKPRPKKHKKAA